MKTRKLAFRLIVALGLLALMAVPAATVESDGGGGGGVVATTAVSIDAPAQVAEGADFTVSVNITNVTDFDAAQYDITYDPAVLTVDNVTAGNIEGTAIPVDRWGFVAADTIRVINNIPGTDGKSGTGTLAIIHFHADGTAPATSNITLSNGLLGKNDATKIDADWPSGPVTVNIAAIVTADFSANVTEVLVGQPITFTASATGGSGTYTYAWDFGDDGTSADANPEHAYANANTYTVSLTVTDTTDGSDTETKTDYIHVYPALAASCSADKIEIATGESVSFNGTATGGKSGYTYSWDFGDGTTSTLESPTYSYAASSNHTVTLTVTDSLGNTDTDTITVIVHKRGDADKDGKILANDVTYVEHIIMEDPGYDATSWADATGDGNWNALDITEIELNVESP
jgi:PKD repeat protein